MRSSFLSKVFKNPLLKVSSFTLLSTLVRMLTSFFTNKIIAILIGPGGMAIVGQFGNFSNILFSFSTGGVSTGTTKFVSQYKNEPDKYKPYIVFTLKLSIILSVIIGILLVLFSSLVSIQVLGSKEYSGVITIFGLTLIFYSLNTSLLSIINGFGQYKKYVLLNIINSILGLTFTVLLVYLWNLRGALIAMVTYQSIVFLVTYIFVKSSKWFSWLEILQKTKKTIRNELLQYSLMTIIGTLFYPTSQMIIRHYLMINVSLTDAGIWEGINRVSNIYLLLITSTLSVYYLPRLSELKSNKEIRNEVFGTLKIITPFVAISGILAILFRFVIIRMLFTKDFLGMGSLFTMQFFGNTIKVVGWLIAYPLLAKKMTKQFITTEIFYNGCWILLSLPLINILGTKGAVLGYMISYILYFFYILYIMRGIIFLRNNEH